MSTSKTATPIAVTSTVTSVVANTATSEKETTPQSNPDLDYFVALSFIQIFKLIVLKIFRIIPK